MPPRPSFDSYWVKSICRDSTICKLISPFFIFDPKIPPHFPLIFHHSRKTRIGQLSHFFAKAIFRERKT